MLNIKPGYPFVFVLTFVLVFACAGGVDAQSKRSKKPVKKSPAAAKDGQAPPTLKPSLTGKAKSETAKTGEIPAKTESAAKPDTAEKPAEKAAHLTKTESKDASPQTEAKEKSAAVSSESAKTDAKAEPKQNPATANPKAEVKEKASASPTSSKKKAKGKPVVAAKAPVKETNGAKENHPAPATSTAKTVEPKAAPKKEAAKETAVAEKKTEPKKTTVPPVTTAKKAEPKKKIAPVTTVAGVTAVKKAAPKKPEVKKDAEASAPAKPKPPISEETVLAAAPAKTWLPPISTDKLRADLNGKTVAGIPSEETGDGTIDWLFAANQPKDVEIIKVDRNEDERVIEARLSAKKTHANLDGSFERVRGTARFHYERGRRGWELLYVENVSLRHGDTAPAGAVESPAQKPAYTAPAAATAAVLSAPPVNIISGASVNIGAGKYQSYSFQVRDTALLTGKFRAQGGPQNDIEAYVLDQDGFLNWTNNHSAPAYYNSGRLTVGTIDTVLGAGTYYLVFNNRYSQDDRKTVEANLQLRTDQASLAAVGGVNAGSNGAGVGTITTVRRTYAPNANPVQPYVRPAETVAVKKSAPAAPVQQISEVAGYKDEVVLSDRFDISGGQHYAIPFSVNHGGAVRGTFNVAGGEIEAYIMTAAQYNKWNATREGVLDYSSGRVTGGSITRSLGAGDYYLVFSNRYSPREPKTVRAQIQVEYLPR